MTHQYLPTTKNKKTGFTLVELLIYFALVSVLLVMVGGMFISIMESRSAVSAVTSLDRDGQFILMRLQYDLRRADEVIVPELDGEMSAQLQLDIDGEIVTYQLTDGQLSLTAGDETGLLHDQTTVDVFEVTRIGDSDQTPVIQIRLEISSIIEERVGARSRVFETSIGLR